VGRLAVVTRRLSVIARWVLMGPQGGSWWTGIDLTAFVDLVVEEVVVINKVEEMEMEMNDMHHY
jgi:hypothetical protein